MAENERKLPDLVSRLRTVYDSEGIDKAKADARSLQQELNKAGESNAPLTMDEKWARTQARLEATKTAGTETAAALTQAGEAGTTGAASTEAALLGVATAGAAATATIGAGVAALAAFNRAGAEGRLAGEQAVQYRELRDATTGLSESLDDVAVAAGAALAPVVEIVSTLATPVVRAFTADIAGAGSAISLLTEAAIGPVATIAKELDRLGIGGDAAAKSQQELADEAHRAARELADEQKAAELTARAIDVLAEAQLSEVEAGLNLERRQERLAEAQQKVADAEARVNELRAGGRTDEAVAAAEKLRDAQERLADAHRKVAEATITVADKEEDLREAEFRQGVQSEEAIKARREVERARLDLQGRQGDVADATAGVSKAQQRLDEASGTKALQDAEADLATARRDLRDRALDVADAEADLAEAHAKANSELFDGEQKIEAHKQALLRWADTIGGTVGEKLRGLADDIRTVNDAMASIFQGTPAAALLTTDLATGAPLGSATARSAGAPSSALAAAPTSPIATTPAAATTTVQTSLSASPASFQQINNITVPTVRDLAPTVDDQLMWLRGNAPA